MKGEVAFETLAWRLRMISEVTKATREFFPSYVQIDWRIVDVSCSNDCLLCQSFYHCFCSL